MAISIVTDSTADLPADLVQAFGIHIVPLNVMFGNESYLDGVTMKSGEFYRRLQAGEVFPTTSQPAPGRFLEKYRELAASSDGILSIHIAESLSKTYNSALHARDELGAGGPPVRVIDSRQVSMGLGLIVLEVAQAVRDGADMDAAASLAEDLAGRTRIIFMVDTLEYLRRGGRIGAASAFLGSLLRIHPILGIEDGAITPIERPRSRRKGLVRLRELARASGPVSSVAVCSGDDPEAARELAADLRSLTPDRKIIVGDFGAIVGAHAGPRAIGVTLIGERPG